MRAALLLVMATAACASPAPSASPSPTAVTSRRGAFELTFAFERTEWQASEAIVGQATLRVLDPLVDTISGSGPVAFRFEATGVLVEPVRPASCEAMNIVPGQPIVSPIEKSGEASPDDGRHPFGADWFRDPELHLPPGEWLITAIALFHEGRDCGAPELTLTAPVAITVVE